MSSPHAGGQAIVSGRKQRSRTACKQCRQAKVKCGLDKIPCARCVRLGNHCEWDPGFKRTNNQLRVNTLEQQLQALQAEMKRPNSAGPSHPSPEQSAVRASLPHTPHQDERPQNGGPTHFSTARSLQSAADMRRSEMPSLETPASHTPEPHQPSYSIPNVRLSGEEAANLFSIYFDKFHSHIPFMESSRGPQECFDLSQMLFWAVISVAARHEQPSKDFVSDVSSFLGESMSDILLGNPKQWQLGDVQALLLMSLWPPFNVSFWGDRSVAVANLALTGATSLGLHNPGFEQEYDFRKVDMSNLSKAERLRTWVACVSVAQQLAMDYGLSCKLPFDHWKIIELCEGLPAPDVPADLQHFLLIQYKSYAAINSLPQLGSNAYCENEYLMSITEAEAPIDQLRDIPNLSLTNQIYLISLKLMIQSMYLQLDVKNSYRKDGAIKAYHSAVLLITMAMSENGSNDLLLYSPRTTSRILLLAGGTILKVLHSDYGSAVDRSYGKVLFNAAILCIRQTAVQLKGRKDLPHRFADVLRGLWQMAEKDISMTQEPPRLCIHTKLGVCILYDCMASFFDRLHLHRQGLKKDLHPHVPWEEQVDVNEPSFGTPDLDLDLIMADLPKDWGWDVDSGEYPDVYNFL